VAEIPLAAVRMSMAQILEHHGGDDFGPLTAAETECVLCLTEIAAQAADPLRLMHVAGRLAQCATVLVVGRLSVPDIETAESLSVGFAGLIHELNAHRASTIIAAAGLLLEASADGPQAEAFE
jgi:hypothetical protein